MRMIGHNETDDGVGGELTSLDEMEMSNMQDQSLLMLEREWMDANAKVLDMGIKNARVNNFTVEEGQFIKSQQNFSPPCPDTILEDIAETEDESA